MKPWLTISIIFILLATGSFALHSCKPDNAHDPTIVHFQVPSGFPATQHIFQNNPLTKEAIALGKKLFYDGRLSRDGNHSCASCHQPEAAFTTFEHDRSHGYNNSHTLRNAPGLFNLAWYPYFNQDGGEQLLTSLIQKHIEHPNEMAESMGNVIRKLEGDEEYRKLFKDAYGVSLIKSPTILHALSQFCLSLVSADSKYDKVKKGQAAFSSEEQAGYVLFQQKCASCHQEPLFTDFSFRNVGLPRDPFLNDIGRMRITKRSEDSLKFRVPSLRNVEFTSYYTHDGRFSLPRHMLVHYRTGVQAGPTLDPQLSGGISMTTAEENALVSFMRTLSDSAFLNNPANR